MYRAVSSEYISKIKIYGLDPKRDPFQPNKKDIYRLFQILTELKEKHGFVIMRWWGRSVDQLRVISCTKVDLRFNRIDFTPSHSNALYFKSLRGGALTNTIYFFTEELLLKKEDLQRSGKSPLDKRDLPLIMKLNRWAKQRMSFKNKIIWIKADSDYFEHAHFQIGGKYYPSPMGDFNNFKKAVRKIGFDFYKPYLEGKRIYFLRTFKRIPASEIYKIE
jgi:hypothetical protein